MLEQEKKPREQDSYVPFMPIQKLFYGERLTIAIDFDGTFGADPDTFRKIVEIFQNAGHTCVLITSRSEEWGRTVKEEVGDIMPIVFAGSISKRQAANAHGYKVDIWIDDSPELIDTFGLKYIGGDN